MLSHWLTEAGLSTDDAAPALEGDTRADVCIIGGGFCGLWTAIRLKQRDPSIDIAIIEAGSVRQRRERTQRRLRAELVGQVRLPSARFAPRTRRCGSHAPRPMPWARSASSALTTGLTRTIAATAGFGPRPVHPRSARGTPWSTPWNATRSIPSSSGSRKRSSAARAPTGTSPASTSRPAPPCSRPCWRMGSGARRSRRACASTSRRQ